MSMRLRVAIGLVAFASLATALPRAVAAPAQPVLLRMVRTVGERSTYLCRADGTMRVDLPTDLAGTIPDALAGDIGFHISVEVSTAVREVADGVADLGLSINAVQLGLRIGDRSFEVVADSAKAQVVVDGEVTFDSTEGELADVPLAGLLFGRELFLARMNDVGDLVGMGLTGLLSAVADTPAVQDVFEHIAQMVPATLPTEPVRVGDTWQSPVVVDVPEMGLTGGGEIRFVLRSLGDAAAGTLTQVGVRGTVGVADFHLAEAVLGLPMIGVDAETMDIPGVRLSGLTTVKGEMLLDPATNQLERLNCTADLRTTLDAGIPGITAGILTTADCSIERLSHGPSR